MNDEKDIFYISAEIKDMKNQEIISVVYRDRIYKLMENPVEKILVDKKIDTTIKSYRDKPRRIENWIVKNNITTFETKDFLKDANRYPRCKLDGTISNMIKEGKLLQVGNDKFKVTKKLYDYMEEFK